MCFGEFIWYRPRLEVCPLQKQIIIPDNLLRSLPTTHSRTSRQNKKPWDFLRSELCFHMMNYNYIQSNTYTIKWKHSPRSVFILPKFADYLFSFRYLFLYSQNWMVFFLSPRCVLFGLINLLLIPIMLRFTIIVHFLVFISIAIRSGHFSLLTVFRTYIILPWTWLLLLVWRIVKVCLVLGLVGQIVVF